MLETDHYVATKEVKEPVVHMTDKDQRTDAEHEATDAVEEEGFRDQKQNWTTSMKTLGLALRLPATTSRTR